MPAPRKPLSDRFNLAASIDDQKARKIFIEYGFSEKAQELGLEYLNFILKQAQIYEDDVCYEDRLQSHLGTFQTLVDALEAFDASLEELEQPRQRHRSDPKSYFYLDQPGTQVFREVIGDLFARIYNPSSKAYQNLPYVPFLELDVMPVRGGPLRPPIRPETEPVIAGFRTDEFRQSITQSMLPVSREVLRCFKAAASAAKDEMASAKNTRGGQGRHPLELLTIQNLAILWHKAFDGKKPIYADASNPLLMNFMNDICPLLGFPPIATEYAINQVRPMVKNHLLATNTR